MTAKKNTKREFDWRSYSKPARLLLGEQETALRAGVLRPVLELCLAPSEPRLDLEIRARQAAIYYRGAPIARITGTSAPFCGAIDVRFASPRHERPDAEQLETTVLADAPSVDAFVANLQRSVHALDGFSASEGETPSAREELLRFADANRQNAAELEILVVDIEYQYGRRKFDFVAMRRAAAVGGVGAFTTPRLVLGEVYSGHRPPSAAAGLTSFGADGAEFAHALRGEHIERAKAELGELALQRMRLGILGEAPFARFTEGVPEVLVVATSPEIVDPDLDAALAELHDRTVARHFPPELLRFALAGRARGVDGSFAVGEDDVLSYREFKAARRRASGA
jgi:hypothetical protein